MYAQSKPFPMQIYVSPTPAQSRQDCALLLNHRPIFNDALFQAVRSGLGLQEKAPYPTFFLSLQLDPKLFDVNVHPTKKQVKFADTAAVTQAIVRLLHPATAPTIKTPQPIQHIIPAVILPVSTPAPAPKPSEPKPTVETPQALVEAKQVPSIPITAPAISASAEATPVQLIPIGWYKDTYLLAHPDGILCANIERILQYLFIRNKIEPLTFLSPISIEISPKWKVILLENSDLLAKVGISVDEFGARTLRIVSIPRELESVDLVNLFCQLAQAIHNQTPLLTVLGQNLPYHKPMQPHVCVQEVFGTGSSVFGRHYWLIPSREILR
jgi:DNA mismatch repair protein MutL